MKKELNRLTELKEEAKNTRLVEREYNLEEDEETSDDEEKDTDHVGESSKWKQKKDELEIR